MNKNKNNLKLTKKIRIIGGQWRNKKISIPDLKDLKPTPNRVRETLFNWLLLYIHGARCLDCFAGSGSLGIEALSRNALNVTLLEKNPTISKLLFKNTQLLQTKQANIFTTDSFQWLIKYQGSFDIIFIDPPFYHNMVNYTIKLLHNFQHLAHNSWIYIETEKHSSKPIVPYNWQLRKEKTAGQVKYSLYFCTSK